MKTLTITIGLFLVSMGVLGQEPADAITRLQNTTSLRCQFGPGTGADWESGKLNVEEDNWGSEPSYFDSIDVQAKTARLIGNAGSAGILVMITATGMHFIEVTPVGNLNVTTVFGSLDQSGNFLAVTSRHVDLFGPVPSQYYGTCEPWQ